MYICSTQQNQINVQADEFCKVHTTNTFQDMTTLSFECVLFCVLCLGGDSSRLGVSSVEINHTWWRCGLAVKRKEEHLTPLALLPFACFSCVVIWVALYI